jgi:hypothetical protein
MSVSSSSQSEFFQELIAETIAVKGAIDEMVAESSLGT